MDSFLHFLNREVVVDMEAIYVYIGEVENVSDKTVTLINADVHDLRDSETTRERYVLDTKLHGVRANRQRVLLSRTQVLSMSLLEDILE